MSLNGFTDLLGEFVDEISQKNEKYYLAKYILLNTIQYEYMQVAKRCQTRIGKHRYFID
jgi:hypothetical protein